MMPELLLTWNGIEYRCRTSFDVIMHIEQKIALGELASRAVDASVNGRHMPSSHIAWVFYCLLRGAGAPVSQDDVWGKVKSGDSTATIVKVIEFIIAEVYGTSPAEKAEDDEEGDDEKKT